MIESNQGNTQPDGQTVEGLQDALMSAELRRQQFIRSIRDFMISDVITRTAQDYSDYGVSLELEAEKDK